MGSSPVAAKCPDRYRRRGLHFNGPFAQAGLQQFGDEPRPTGLVRCAGATSTVAVKVFVKEQVVAKVWVVLHSVVVTENRASAFIIAQEEPGQPRGELARYFFDGVIAARSGGALDLEVVAVVV